MVRDVATDMQTLPALARPDNQSVGVVTMHPQALAKSYHPQTVLDRVGLRQVGSRPSSIRPEKWKRQNEPTTTATTDLFVAGKVESFEYWARLLAAGGGQLPAQIQRIEMVRSLSIDDRLRDIPTDLPQPEPLVLEVVLHVSDSPREDFVLSGFENFVNTLGVLADFDRRIYAGGLCFIPVEILSDRVRQLAEFSFLRVARPISGLRDISPIERAVPQPSLPESPLPSEGPVDPDLRIAIFDGGLDKSTPLSRWARSFDGQGVGSTTPGLTAHGSAVTSAALFGTLDPGEPAPTPYASIDHYRVVDKKSEDDPYELYDVLKRIEAVLRERRYEFISLSIGPALPIENDEVHPWTALLDDLLSDGHTFASVAVGNNGKNLPVEEARILVPSDSVNALSVGSADTVKDGWARADYSAIGPGRQPGRIKPDVLSFGGTQREPFIVYDAYDAPLIAAICGTSFATPAAVRIAAGLRAHFGGRLSSLALKSLLIHSAQRSDHDPSEVGWGRIPTDLQDIVVCDGDTIRVLYQGELPPSQYLRAPVPLPDEQLTGIVEIKATFCYATPVDPQDPSSYTRSGLDVTFRPHALRFTNDRSPDPAPKPFFRRTKFDTEEMLRQDGQKWETTLHATKKLRGSSLHIPVFDIHHNARLAGGATQTAETMKYALVVTVRSVKTSDLYEKVATQYAGRLEALQPLVEVPIRIR
ncbi:S8 family peptidase [Actinomadura atramentaria]|uniref:S8 family peptidase n=1 Tax=Actinomadura atramentaria TaxID=1990 RepID=UPI001969DFD3|nr:S8 family peptidase [Actinomadura atramentaria]